MSAKRGIRTKRDSPVSMVAVTPGGMESENEDDFDFDDDDNDGFFSHTYSYKNFKQQNHEPNPSYRQQKAWAPTPGGLQLDENETDENINVADNNIADYTKQQLDEFYSAILNEDLIIVQKCVENGIAVDSELRSGWNALMLACSRGSHEIIEYLLANESDPNSHMDGFTALMAVCSSSCKEESILLQCVKQLIKSGADINAYNRYHMTALMFCARDGKKLIVDLLIENGVQTEFVNNQGWTALAWAISSGYEIIVRTLLEANPTLETIKVNEQDWVEFAQNKNQKKIAEILGSYTKSKSFAMESAPDVSVQMAPPQLRPFPVKDKSKKIQYGDLDTFLCGLRLSHLIAVFHTQEIQFSQLLLLNDDDLIKIGIDQLGPRKAILEGIRAIHQKEWEKTSLQTKKKSQLSCPAIVAIVENIGQHQDYCRSTIVYLHRAIKENPEILEKEQDVNDIDRLLETLNRAGDHNDNLQNALQDFQSRLNKIRDNVEYKPGNLIVPEKHVKKSCSSVSMFAKISTMVGFITIASFLTVKIYLKR